MKKVIDQVSCLLQLRPQMSERVQEFLSLRGFARILYIENEIKRKQDPVIRAYVGTFWGTVYNLNGESIDAT